MKSRIFLTGATGFIGSNLARQFVKEDYPVVALARPTSSTRFIDHYVNSGELEIRRGDITSKQGLDGSMKGCSVLIHCASFVGDWGLKKDYYQTNVEGTKNVLREARDSGIQQAVLISSNAVLGEEDCLEKKAEDFPYNPTFPYFINNIFESDMNHYRNTKMLAEKETINFCQENNIDLTVVRPVWVYGPREFNAGPYIFCKSICEGNRFFPGTKNNKFHTIYVEDLAKITTRLTEKNLKGVNIFNVGSEEVHTMDKFWNSFCEELGKKPPIYLPRSLVYPIGFAMESLYKLFKSKKAPLLTRARVEMGYCNNLYDTKKVRTEIGDFQDTSLEKGVERTIRWWKNNGYL